MMAIQMGGEYSNSGKEYSQVSNFKDKVRSRVEGKWVVIYSCALSNHIQKCMFKSSNSDTLNTHMEISHMTPTRETDQSPIKDATANENHSEETKIPQSDEEKKTIKMFPQFYHMSTNWKSLLIIPTLH